MSPDPQAAMLAAIAQGPAFLPDTLLEGSQAAQYRALKAHANTINHARHVAIEQSFPRTRARLGEAAFHALASDYLARTAACERPLRTIGIAFAQAITDLAARDLARVEYAWLESHDAADAPALLLDHLGYVSPETLVASTVRRHPAARTVPLSRPEIFSWEDCEGDGDLVLVTRPHDRVRVTRVAHSVQRLLDLSRTPISFGRLLDRDADAATTLVRAGALRPQLELVL